ncbi:50S ribosomal protein L4 [Marinimicrococcus flavescens]|uniref:Large ribosomal subunit protein uL4 n=1 Tax=Marinimicrococcus flavescens TaxID=3031815 RepID=A0AAP3V3A6_9PROT|nr:50S ribosomal protein L4 [Marinimicrococcus flavescens]
MQVQIKNLAAEDVGAVDLNEAVFGVEIRADILQRVVLWQLAKRRAGTHKVKSRAEISRTKAKMYKQKGTGRARHSSRTTNVFRGGGVVFGPVLRDHATDLPKKVRALGLRCALSSKAKEGKLLVLDEAKLDAPKTKELLGRLTKLGIESAVIIGGAELERNFALASRNLPKIDVLPSAGANVYDILRRDTLVLTAEAVRQLEERLA